MKHPPLRTLFLTDRIGPMAVARVRGGVTWSHRWGDLQGILFWSSLAAAEAWQQAQGSWPFVIAEFGRGCVDMDLALPWHTDLPTLPPHSRAWVYPHEIWFGDVRWYQYQREAVPLPQDPHAAITASIVIPNRITPRDLPQGVITLATE